MAAFIMALPNDGFLHAFFLMAVYCMYFSVRDKRYRIANRAAYFTSCDAKRKRHRLDQNKLRCIEFIHLRYRTNDLTFEF